MFNTHQLLSSLFNDLISFSMGDIAKDLEPTTFWGPPVGPWEHEIKRIAGIRGESEHIITVTA